MSERDEEWTAEERKAFGELAREQSPGGAVEDRILDALRRRGLVLPARPSRWRPLAAVAAGLLLIAAGFAAGRSSARPPAPAAASRFALLLLRGEERPVSRPEEEPGRVAEYRAWARGLARSGRSVEGRKLDDRAVRLVSAAGPAAEAPPSPEEVRGFFIISASSFEEALAVARGCPHLRHGGAILVRPIAF